MASATKSNKSDILTLNTEDSSPCTRNFLGKSSVQGKVYSCSIQMPINLSLQAQNNHMSTCPRQVKCSVGQSPCPWDRQPTSIFSSWQVIWSTSGQLPFDQLNKLHTFLSGAHDINVTCCCSSDGGTALKVSVPTLTFIIQSHYSRRHLKS